jgi:hypothetical protein
MNKVCYVCCVYFGDRRCAVSQYNEDRLSYVREHVKSLEEVSHKLDKIVFVFNLEEEHIHFFEEAKNIVPKRIGNTEVELIPRENYGMSYGAWSDVYEKYRKQFDYYIFNEDDYFFVQDDFDKYLVNKFKSYTNIGYLCGAVMNPAPGVPWVTHAGNSVGISSSTVLDELFNKFGCLPHGKKTINDLEERYGLEEQEGQVSQTYEIFKLGYNIYDIREDYSVPHDMGPHLKHAVPDFDHFVDNYFHWNTGQLFIPAPLRFGHPTYYINVVDQQYQRKRTCYVVNMYFGERRKTVEEYYSDRLCFLKKQIETLSNHKHNLDKIVFSINFEQDHLAWVNEAISLIPKKLQNTDVEVFLRKNVGLSYGAFSDNFARLRNDYDYFIFNEDDYFLVQDSWDEYLIRKYNELPDSGYLCAIMRDADEKWNDGKDHAGHCFGISSTGALDKVCEKYGSLPCSSETNDYDVQEKIQVEFTHVFFKVGLRVYDIREEYRVAFAMTGEHDQDIWRWFWWNEKDLIVPAIFAFDKPHTWWESYDGPCIRRTNLEKYQ